MQKFFRNNIKLFIGIIICGIVFGSVGVLALSMFASDISFIPDDPNWKVNNVQQAINFLYETKKISSGEAFLIQ